MRRTWMLALIALSVTGAAVAQSPRALVFGEARSNFGSVDLAGGFTPSPRTVELTSGGNLSMNSMELGRGCRGFATAIPDYIVRYTEPGSSLRFRVRANAGDTTLVVHTPDGAWRCDDDSGGHTNPLLDIADPPAGQYDVWVGSYRAEQNLSGTLSISEVP